MMQLLNLTLRQRKLLHLLEEQSSHGPLTGEKLARLLNVSVRTIRNDVTAVNRSLEPLGGRIHALKSKGYLFYAENPSLVSELNREASSFFTREDRVRYLAYRLCLSDRPLSLIALETSMYVSRSTLEKDIRALSLRFCLPAPGIRLLSGRGTLSFEPDEAKRRNILLDLFTEHWDYNSQSNALYHYPFVEQDLLAQIFGLVSDCVNRHSVLMEDHGIVRLTLTCAIACQRLRTGHLLPETDDLSKMDSQASQAADDLSNELEKVFHLSLPLAERDAIYSIITAGRLFPTGDARQGTDGKGFPQILKDIANQYIQKIRTVYGYDFSRDVDYAVTLLQFLHLVQQPLHAFSRQDSTAISKENLLIEMELAWLIQDAALDKGKSLLKEEELIHLAICNSGALQYLYHHRPEVKLRTIICCSHHLPVAWSIKRKLQAAFPEQLDVIDLLPMHSISNYDFSNIDLVLTTSVSPEDSLAPADIEELRITPYLTSQDVEQVSARINQRSLFPHHPHAEIQIRNLLKTMIWHTKQQPNSPFEAIELAAQDFPGSAEDLSACLTSLLRREAVSSQVFRNGLAFQFSTIPAKENRLSAALFPHRLDWKGYRIRLLITAFLRPEDRPLYLWLKHYFNNLNHRQDIVNTVHSQEDALHLLELPLPADKSAVSV